MVKYIKNGALLLHDRRDTFVHNNIELEYGFSLFFFLSFYYILYTGKRKIDSKRTTTNEDRINNDTN